ncbi:inorganic triphosphatase [Massilia eurypsychrophila]|jgi:triphosphatase|uniref:Inorganic triphosphatase n=1 Tax=Massilia eurypsychrophila TaxID=1485217 RepID=A0A2G8TG01_9BURK|nr:CYTH and CHAD domain-containing protein [Massilia eurypsychrophila]PIL44980.1 inorganic triphosphatase [Massilia eurypsychrophila]
MEVELKLVIDPQDQDALLQHPLLNGQSASAPREQTVSDTYFDTPDLRLRQSDIGLRVRSVDGGWVQNIEHGDSVHGAIHFRHEWASPVSGATPELRRLREVVDDKRTRRNVLDAAASGKGLAPVFTTTVRRIAWELHPQEGGLIALAFDQGRLECDGKDSSIHELELEMKSGDPAHLFDLALALQNDIPLQIGTRSNADRGYALLAPAVPAAVKATRLALTRDMTAERAFQEIMFNTTAQIHDNAEGVAERHDVESLHQMRVGMRRLRLALSMYKRLLRLPVELQQELDWLATELGGARDWDVLAGSTLPTLARQLAEPRQIDAVRGAAEENARQHREAAAAAVASPRYTRLMLGINRWVQAMDWHDELPSLKGGEKQLMAPVMAFASATLKRNRRRLHSRGTNLDRATVEARHRVRIAAKKNRYAAEFFGSLFSPRQVKPYVKALTCLQDELGLLNDAAVADRLLSGIADARPDLSAEVGFITGFMTAATVGRNKEISTLWKRVDKMRVPG